MCDKGVALVIISTVSPGEVALDTISLVLPSGAVHVLMYAGKETSRTIRAVIAGLAKLCPNPPNISFTTTIATREPIAAIHNGIAGGRLSASIRPVTTAERSPTETGLFIILQHKYSAKTAVTMQVSITRIGRHPNIKHPPTAAGNKAIKTSAMIPREVS